MKHNPVAKYAHLFNRCKMIDTSNNKSLLFLVSGFSQQGEFIESEVFESLKQAHEFEKQLVNSGLIVSLDVL
jgi:polyphosphate kinase 2 (PPK2 family)